MNLVDRQCFWQWAHSDFLSNAQRGVLAEYIVASAVGATDKPRTEWDAYDVVTPSGLKIEVKSSAYLQTWEQKQHSTIRFDIAHKKSWDAASNTSSALPLRSADLYVFCVFASQDKGQANPLDLSQWFFLVCTTVFLNEQFSKQKSVALSSLERAGLVRIKYDDLASIIGTQTSRDDCE